jgi:integrase
VWVPNVASQRCHQSRGSLILLVPNSEHARTSADIVRQLLASINRQTAVGRRDYAVLLLLARLGLRAGEVVRIELADLDWKAGSMRGRST